MLSKVKNSSLHTPSNNALQTLPTYLHSPYPIVTRTSQGPSAGKGGEKKGGSGESDQDPRLYSVRIARATGIEWGTDISFSWVYVRALEPDGAAANCGEISVGDQVCGAENGGSGCAFWT